MEYRADSARRIARISYKHEEMEWAEREAAEKAWREAEMVRINCKAAKETAEKAAEKAAPLELAAYQAAAQMLEAAAPDEWRAFERAIGATVSRIKELIQAEDSYE